MERAFKTKLILNNTEQTYLRHCCDVSRFVYNWALADRKTAYETDKTNVGYNDQDVGQKRLVFRSSRPAMIAVKVLVFGAA